MTKKTAILLITIILTCCLCAQSWAAGIVALKSLDIKPYNQAVEGFRETCECDVTELTLPEKDQDDITRRILNGRPAAILAVGIDALDHVLAIRQVPVLFTMVPSSHGIPADATNVSGVNAHISAERNLAAISDAMPEARRIGILYDPRNSERMVQDAQAAAKARGLHLVLKKVGRAGEVPAALEGLGGKIDLLWMIPDATVINNETVRQIFLFSFQNSVPVYTFSRKFVEMGAVAALNVIPYDMGAQAGGLAARLLKEGEAGPLRQTPRKTTLVINGKVARKLGLKLREDIMRRAEDVGR